MRFFLLAIALMLAGCSHTHSLIEEGRAAMDRGDLNTAYTKFLRAAEAGEPVGWNNLGVVYERRGERATAVIYYRLAARYGVPIAQSNLAKLGEPIPDADLAALRDRARERESRAMMNAATILLAPSIAPPSFSGGGFLKRSYNSGFNTICIYDRLGSDYVVTIRSGLCPLSAP